MRTVSSGHCHCTDLSSVKRLGHLWLIPQHSLSLNSHSRSIVELSLLISDWSRTAVLHSVSHCVHLFVTLLTVATRLFCAWGCSGKNRLPFPSPSDLPNPGIEPKSSAFPALAGRFLTTESPGKSLIENRCQKKSRLQTEEVLWGWGPWDKELYFWDSISSSASSLKSYFQGLVSCLLRSKRGHFPRIVTFKLF